MIFEIFWIEIIPNSLKIYEIMSVRRTSTSHSITLTADEYDDNENPTDNNTESLEGD